MPTERRARAAFGLLAAGAVAAAAGCAPELGRAPFRCSLEDTRCPSGYRCNSSFCVREDAPEPVLLSTTVDENESAFSLHERRNELLVCWRHSLASRQPGLHGAVLTPQGQVRIADEPLYTQDAFSVALLADLAGDCTQQGDDTIVAITRLSGTEQYALRVRRYDIDRHAWTDVRSELFHRHGFSLFNVTNVGGETWMTTVQNEGPCARGDTRLRYRTIVSSTFEVTTEELCLPAIAPEQEVVTTEMLGGTDGAWLTTLFRSGEIDLAWIRRERTNANYLIEQPAIVGSYLSGYPLAVRGRQLAMAYQVDPTTWRVVWIEPTMMMTSMTREGSIVTEGPTFRMPAGVVRPGGYADGDQLVVAGTDLEANSNGTDHVTVWSVPWGTAETPRRLGEISKISTLVPRRLAVTRAGNVLQVGWTERVPATQNGFTEYSALFVSSFQGGPAND